MVERGGRAGRRAEGGAGGRARRRRVGGRAGRFVEEDEARGGGERGGHGGGEMVRRG